MSNEKSLTPWLFLLPGLILFSIYVLYPIVRSFWVSFYEWDGMAEPIFVGWGNYIELFDDEVFWVSVQNNIIWLLLFLTSPAIGLAIALFLNQKIRGIRAVKSLLFFPFVCLSSKPQLDILYLCENAVNTTNIVLIHFSGL